MVTAFGKELFMSLFVLVFIDLYRLLEGRRSNREIGMGAVTDDAGHSVKTA